MPDREALIADLERRIGYPLPADYRRFLLARSPEPWDDEDDEGPPEGGDGYAYEILGRMHHLDGEGPEWADHLTEDYETYQGRMPATLLPISSDPFGNPICLGLAGDECGKVYFCNHEEEGEPEDQPYWENVSKMYESFPDFMADLLKRARVSPAE